MNDDPTPINARSKRRPEALEDLSLALREYLVWPVQDRFMGLGDAGRTAVAGGAVVLALGLGVGGYSLASDEGSEPAPSGPVAVAVEPTPEPEPRVEPAVPQPKPEPKPTLQGAAPVFEPPKKDGSATAKKSKAVPAKASTATASNTGNAATDTISSNPAARPATGASASAAPPAAVDGPPAGPAAIAVARKFAQAFVVYETGGEEAEVREAFAATATRELAKGLMQRPPRQPAGVEVPKAKVLNVVSAPSHDRLYPVSVSLLRVGATSELRLEMEQLKNKQWRVVNVLG